MNSLKALALAVAAIAVARTEATPSAADYVQDGLVMHLDAIRYLGETPPGPPGLQAIVR